MLSDGSSNFLDGGGQDEHLQADTPLGSQTYLPDHLGSTSRLLDSLNGSNKAQYDYTSYGKLEGDLSNPGASNPYTYTGREDDGTGLYYYRARYYDTELEVFISQDPLGDAQRYVNGNPVGLVDPLGLDAWGDVNNFVAGFGDAGSFGISRFIRENYGNGQTAFGRTVDTSSGVYTAGELTILAEGGIGLARLGYAGTARALPYLIRSGGTELEQALAISAARNNLKIAARAGLFPNSRIYTAEQILAKYGNNAEAITSAATRTNSRINRIWIPLSLEALGPTANHLINSHCGAK